jgi:hypothetical protein
MFASLGATALAFAGDQVPPYQIVQDGIRSYLVVLDNIRLTEKKVYRYIITQDKEPPGFYNQSFGIRLRTTDWVLSAQDTLNVKSMMDKTKISVRIFDGIKNEILFEYRGSIFYRDIGKAVEEGLVNGSVGFDLSTGIHYIRLLDPWVQYRLDHYYHLFGEELPFRKKRLQVIELEVIEPMEKNIFYDGSVSVVIRGGGGK